MATPGSGRDFLRLDDRSADEIMRLLGDAARLRRDFGEKRLKPSLRGKRLAAIWDGEGFRNRIAFDLGVRLMGGLLVEVPERLGHREPLGDLGGYLDNWFDGLVIRTPRFDLLSDLAGHMRSPVVNARTAANHPCEILGDLAFVASMRGSIDDLHVVFVGPATNLLGSWLEAAAVLPIELTQVCPEGYDYPQDWIAGNSPADVARSLEVVNDADVIYTDAWPAAAPGEEAPAQEAFESLRITSAVLDTAPETCSFLPCPPVTRGQEVAPEAMHHEKCMVPRAKEWLLHAQNALLLEIFGD